MLSFSASLVHVLEFIGSASSCIGWPYSLCWVVEAMLQSNVLMLKYSSVLWSVFLWSA